MRTAIFTDNDFDKVNGVTTTLKAVLKHAPPGVEARVYTAADLGVRADDYFVAESIGVGLPYYRDMRIYWPRPRVLARELGAHGVDVIHLTTPGPVGLTARWLSRRLGLPMVGSYHTQLGDYASVLSGSPRLGHWTEQYLRWLYAPCDPLLVPSLATRSLLAGYGYPTSRCRLWPRGVDATVFTPDRRSQALRDAWHVDHRRPAVLYAGRLSKEKGLEIVAGVQRALESARIAHRLIFVGDGPMAPELREACPDAVFLGAVPHDRVAVAMASADVFLFPSATDTFGNVVLEAQASGLPTLVTDRGGPSQQIIDGVTGHVCSAGNAGVFAGRLAMLLRNHDQRAEMSASARDYARRRDWSSALASVYAAWSSAQRRGVGVPDPDAVPAHETRSA